MIINKENLQQFRRDFANAISDLEKQYNIKIELQRIGYTDYEFSGKIFVKNLEANSQQQKDKHNNELLNIYGANFDVGFKFNENGINYEVIGFNSRASKKPVQLRDEFGRTYKCSINYVKRFVTQGE